MGSPDGPTDHGRIAADGQAGPVPVLRSPQDFATLNAWIGMVLTGLQDRLDRLRTELRRSMDPQDHATLEAAIERLQVLQIVEQGLAIGDVLPDFALPDQAGHMVTSEELLARGPLVLAFIRGTWCPYCSLALQALDAARPAVEQRGGSMVAVSPLQQGELARAARERGLGLRLLSDPAAAYARVCGVHYEMSDGHVQLYERHGLDLARRNAGSGWALPVPATYVARPDGVITFAHAHTDWAERAEPAAIVAAVERLGQVGAAAG